jgi:tetratricopeptide (TPR) repeat protein
MQEKDKEAIDVFLAQGGKSSGSVKVQKGDLDGAMADYDEGIGLDPKYSTAYQGRGLVKSQKRDNDGAFADFNEAIRLEPKSAAAHVGRGWVSYSKGEKDRAIIDYDQAIELDPKFALAYTDRALAKFSKRDYEGAAMDLSQLIVLDPNNAQAYVDRAIIKLIGRDFDRAIADYGEAVRLDAKLAYPRFYIWLIRFQQQRMTQANEELAAYLDKGQACLEGIGPQKLQPFSWVGLPRLTFWPLPVRQTIRRTAISIVKPGITQV